MSVVAIITDSIACLTRELVEQYGIRILPINFYFGDTVYRDWVDITPDEAYELFLKAPDSFKTSAINPMDCLEAYREASQQSRDILCITLSAKLSATYDVACMAKEQAKTELPQTSIEVMDSRMAAAAEGFIVLAAAKAAAAGKSLAEVISIAREVSEKVNIVAVMNTVRYAYRTGRIPKVASQVASILSIRPVFTFSAGAPSLICLARNKSSGVSRLLKQVKDKVGESPVHIAVMHAYARDEAEQLKQQVSATFNCVELWLTEFSPVMGYACGTGTLGLAYYKEG